MVRLLVALLVVGGRRLEHVKYLQNDPLLRRFCQLRVVPTARTVSRWLTQFTNAASTRTIAKCRAITRSSRTWRRPPTSCA
jgi:hypothetical protein